MKSMRTILLISGVIVLISLGVVVYMMFWGPDHLELGGRSLSELLKSGDLTPLIVIPIVLIVSAVTILPFLRIMFPAEIKNGVTAQAKVLEVWDTGVSINDNPQVGLLLEVSPPSGSPFQVKAKSLVSRLNAALV
jgi:formate hydrogenlyase subunit 3/multisubunit Na+/H+ antiporter MnhD subunit